MEENNPLPEIISINKLCSMMSISRSRYYQILSEGLILPPIYSPNTKRPYFSRETALRNLEVKKNNIGVNGKICIFYNVRNSPISSGNNNSPKKENKKKPDNKYTDIIEGLNCLGLNDIKIVQIEEAIKKSFPNGTDNVDEGEVLKAVFCLISAQNSTDKQDR